MNKRVIHLNKWHFKFGLIPVCWRPHCLMFHFGIFKPTSFPPEGEIWTKEYYKGFWLRKEWFGFEISF